MNVSNLTFPVICFWRHLVRVERSLETLTTTTAAGLKNQMFDNVVVVGSNGVAGRIKTATKLHGIGPFWGYNMFLNQRIKVDIVFDDESFVMTVEDLRKRLLAAFGKWHGWQTRGDFLELKAAIENAKTVSEIIQLVKD
jgi:hypothetical protein